ncbi:Uncharacterized protein dnl_41680 [Desulfonema limicola]|uniref:Lipoprotein n=1 Tax=Desulfonema limicola TaxID=45656 RepID=A0A975BAM8_9BACT|nr:hypothetical protein [Desulfonema limicola]QTA81817.1 Uncharacterized protein dnl_41680 [Desulfonema limicola]
MKKFTNLIRVLTIVSLIFIIFGCNGSDDDSNCTNTEYFDINGGFGGGGGDGGDGGDSGGSGGVGGEAGDGSDTSPLPYARCYLVTINGQTVDDCNGVTIETEADEEGIYKFENVRANKEFFIVCYDPEMENLKVSTFVSTVGQPPGFEMTDQDVMPDTTVVSNIIKETIKSGQEVDLKALKEERMSAIKNETDPDLVLLAKSAVELFFNMYKVEKINSTFSSLGNSAEEGALEDLFEDGSLDQPGLASIKERVETFVEEKETELGTTIEEAKEEVFEIPYNISGATGGGGV